MNMYMYMSIEIHRHPNTKLLFKFVKKYITLCSFKLVIGV